jgi:ABC-type transport system involved in multi-copper enzyme maturation permease subunit
MTASTIMTSPSIRRPRGRADAILGFGPLFRKDLAEWTHGPRIWVVTIVTSLFMALSAANAWLNAWVVANLPTDPSVPRIPMSMLPFDNVLAAVGSQIFVAVAIFASMSLIVVERENGALAWLASKPVARGGIWASKAAAAVAVLWVVAAIVPLAITTAIVTLLYGAPAIGQMVVLVIGVGAVIAFFVAVVLAASTVVSSQPAVAGIGLAALVLPSIVGALLPFSIEPYLPTSILGWAVGLAMGAEVGVATPVAWAIAMGALVAFATWRMDRLEL